MSERDDVDDDGTSITDPPGGMFERYERRIAEALTSEFDNLGVDGNTNRATLNDARLVASVQPEVDRHVVAIEHHAGPMIELVQKCTRCGEVIEDYRNCAFAPGDSPGLGFAEGPVTRAGRATFTGTLDGAQKCGQREA